MLETVCGYWDHIPYWANQSSLLQMAGGGIPMGPPVRLGARANHREMQDGADDDAQHDGSQPVASPRPSSGDAPPRRQDDAPRDPTPATRTG